MALLPIRPKHSARDRGLSSRSSQFGLEPAAAAHHSRWIATAKRRSSVMGAGACSCHQYQASRSHTGPPDGGDAGPTGCWRGRAARLPLAADAGVMHAAMHWISWFRESTAGSAYVAIFGSWQRAWSAAQVSTVGKS